MDLDSVGPGDVSCAPDDHCAGHSVGRTTGQAPGHRDGDREGVDGGYTLIEVVLALVLVMILVLSAAKVLITATDRTAVLEQQQTAPLVANQAMERVKAVTATSTSTLATALVAGRNPGDVSAQWSAASTSVLDLAWPVADPSAASGSTGAVVPLRSSATVGATTYTVSTYLGVCERLRAATAAASCSKQAGGVAAVVPAGYVRMVRAVIEVSWTPRSGSGCAGGRCSYTVSGLIDPTPDLTWNPNATTVASTTSAAGSGS